MMFFPGKEMSMQFKFLFAGQQRWHFVWIRLMIHLVKGGSGLSGFFFGLPEVKIQLKPAFVVTLLPCKPMSRRSLRHQFFKSTLKYVEMKNIAEKLLFLIFDQNFPYEQTDFLFFLCFFLHFFFGEQVLHFCDHVPKVTNIIFLYFFWTKCE